MRFLSVFGFGKTKSDMHAKDFDRPESANSGLKNAIFYL